MNKRKIKQNKTQISISNMIQIVLWICSTFLQEEIEPEPKWFVAKNDILRDTVSFMENIIILWKNNFYKIKKLKKAIAEMNEFIEKKTEDKNNENQKTRINNLYIEFKNKFEEILKKHFSKNINKKKKTDAIFQEKILYFIHKYFHEDLKSELGIFSFNFFSYNKSYMLENFKNDYNRSNLNKSIEIFVLTAKKEELKESFVKIFGYEVDRNTDLYRVGSIFELFHNIINKIVLEKNPKNLNILSNKKSYCENIEHNIFLLFIEAYIINKLNITEESMLSDNQKQMIDGLKFIIDIFTYRMQEYKKEKENVQKNMIKNLNIEEIMNDLNNSPSNNRGVIFSEHPEIKTFFNLKVYIIKNFEDETLSYFSGNNENKHLTTFFLKFLSEIQEQIEKDFEGLKNEAISAILLYYKLVKIIKENRINFCDVIIKFLNYFEIKYNERVRLSVIKLFMKATDEITDNFLKENQHQRENHETTISVQSIGNQ